MKALVPEAVARATKEIGNWSETAAAHVKMEVKYWGGEAIVDGIRRWLAISGLTFERRPSTPRRFSFDTPSRDLLSRHVTFRPFSTEADDPDFRQGWDVKWGNEVEEQIEATFYPLGPLTPIIAAQGLVAGTAFATKLLEPFWEELALLVQPIGNHEKIMTGREGLVLESRRSTS